MQAVRASALVLLAAMLATSDGVSAGQLTPAWRGALSLLWDCPLRFAALRCELPPRRVSAAWLCISHQPICQGDTTSEMSHHVVDDSATIATASQQAGVLQCRTVCECECNNQAI